MTPSPRSTRSSRSTSMAAFRGFPPRCANGARSSRRPATTPGVRRITSSLRRSHSAGRSQPQTLPRRRVPPDAGRNAIVRGTIRPARCEPLLTRRPPRSQPTVDDAIGWRRSVREYSTDPVSDATMRDILDLARRAPSSMDGQPCHFVVIRERARLHRLAAIKNAHCPPEKSDFPADFIVHAPVVVAVCTERARSHARALEDAVLATAFLLLAAGARGLGGVYLSATRATDAGLATRNRRASTTTDNRRPRHARATRLSCGRSTARRRCDHSRRSCTMKCSDTETTLTLNRGVESSRSVVLRYLEAVDFPEISASHGAFRALLERCSLAEGARLFSLLTHAGVELFVLDESSAMHTRTLKSIDGCVTIAACLSNGFDRIVFETGGNTGNALTIYGRHAGLETFCVVPEENLTLLDRRGVRRRAGASGRGARSGDGEAGCRTARGTVRRGPSPARGLADRRVALSRLFHSRTHPARVRVQPFRPDDQRRIRSDRDLRRARTARRGAAGLCRSATGGQLRDVSCAPDWSAGPRARACDVHGGAPEPGDVRRAAGTYGTYDALAHVLDRSRGDITTIDHSEFDRAFADHDAGRHVFASLAAHGFTVGRRDGRIIDKTGLMSIAGALKAIDAGAIPHGSRVLCAMTSGAGTADGLARPDLSVDDLDAFERDARARWFQGGHACVA